MLSLESRGWVPTDLQNECGVMCGTRVTIAHDAHRIDEWRRGYGSPMQILTMRPPTQASSSPLIISIVHLACDQHEHTHTPPHKFGCNRRHRILSRALTKITTKG
jgi:hypothetical protein